MRRVGLLVGTLFFLVVVLLLIPYYIATEPKLPDYANWERVVEGRYPFTLNGKPAQLLQESYQNVDTVNLKTNQIDLFYNENDGLWLAQQTEKSGKRQWGGGMTAKGTNVYLFENVGGKWVFVRDVSEFKKFEDYVVFLSQKYNLDIKE